MRKRIYEIIEVAEGEDKSSQIYDIFMIISIVLSIVPLAFKESNVCFLAIDKITVCICIIG